MAHSLDGAARPAVRAPLSQPRSNSAQHALMPLWAQTVDWHARIAAAQDARAAAQVLADAVAHWSRADVAVVGWSLPAAKAAAGAEQPATRVELVARSGGRPGDLSLDPSQPATREHAAVLAEVIDQQATVCTPAAEAEALPPVRAAQRHWVRGGGCAWATTWGPVAGLQGHAPRQPHHPSDPGLARARLEPAFAVAARRHDAQDPFTTDELAALDMALALVGPLLSLHLDRDNATGPAWRRRLRRWWAGGSHSCAMARRRRRAVVGIAVCALTALLLWPQERQVAGVARVEGDLQRVLTAPQAGHILAAHVRAGELVRRGQLVAELATDDLALELERWSSQLDQHLAAVQTAQAQNDRPQLVLHLARADEARAQRDLAESRLTAAQVLAPMDGVVVKGDLSQRLGAPVAVGEELFVIAAAQGWRVVVQVDERDIAQVAVGQRGRLALAALPWETIGFTVQSVAPLAHTADARNVFEVLAQVDTAPAGLRPGFEGRARIAAERQPLALQWAAAGWQWARGQLWRI